MNNDLISRSALRKQLRAFRNETPHAPTRTYICNMLLAIIGDENQTPTIDAGPKWISVKDRLPETESRCLVVRYDYVTKTSFMDVLWFYKGTWRNRIFGGEYAVTHWMPLPEPPKEG